MSTITLTVGTTEAIFDLIAAFQVELAAAEALEGELGLEIDGLDSLITALEATITALQQLASFTGETITGTDTEAGQDTTNNTGGLSSPVDPDYIEISATADPIAAHPDNASLESWWQTKIAQAQTILAQNGIDALWWGFQLFGDGIVQDLDELDQTLKIILSTPQGSDIHRPEFSSGIWTYIDFPIPRATPFVVRESTQAVDEWEPRITLDSVSVQPYSPGIEGLTINAAWTVADSEISTQTEVQIGRATAP